jgi:phenylalanyl-tRNA synthetase beta chain
MIFTRQWVNDLIDINDISTEDLCKTFNAIGLEVDSVQKIRIPAKVVVGYVKECIKHPDADKLNICQVDIGKEFGGVVQIVCGAKNVGADMYVAVSTIGAKLKDKDGNEFKIKKSKLRGEESHGMICSSTELGLPKINDGIMILYESIGELQIGKELNEYKILNDDIIELELTANRGDCLSIYGIARELSAFYHKKINEFDKIEYCSERLGIGKFLNVDHKSDVESSLVYKVLDIKEIKTPLKYHLRVGVLGKSSLDCEIKFALEYITHTTGALLDCFKDEQFDKKNNQIDLIVQKDDNGFDAVYGKEKLSIIGIDTNSAKIKDTKTNDLILQISYSEPTNLAKRVFETSQKTDEIYYRASRGSEPNIEQSAKFAEFLLTSLGAKFYNGSEEFIEDIEDKSLDLNLEKVNKFIGQDTDKTKVEEILRWLKFGVKNAGKNIFNVTVPNFRHDIVNFADVVEEIVRIIGIDNIISKPLAQAEQNAYNRVSSHFQNKINIQNRAVMSGFYETITYVFASKENLSKYGFEVVEDKLDILNPISSELNSFRTTLLTNLLEAVSKNRTQGYKKIPFFEIGTVFDKDRNETTKLSLVFSGEKQSDDISNSGKPAQMDFFGFAKKVSSIIGNIELEENSKVDNKLIHPYQSANIIQDGKEIGIISKLHPSVAKEYNISSETFFAEIDFEKINFSEVQAKPISKFQKSIKDLSFVVPSNLEFKQIKSQINSLNNKLINSFKLIDIYSDEELKSEEKESITIRFELQSDSKTLEDSDINSVMDSIIDTLKSKFDIELR